MKQLPAPLSTGTTWTIDSKCKVKAQGQEIELRITGSGKVTGRVNTTVGGTSVTAWVIDADIKISSAFGELASQKLNQHYSPAHGVSVFRHVETRTPQGSATSDQKLKSLTPKAS